MIGLPPLLSGRILIVVPSRSLDFLTSRLSASVSGGVLPKSIEVVIYLSYALSPSSPVLSYCSEILVFLPRLAANPGDFCQKMGFSYKGRGGT